MKHIEFLKKIQNQWTLLQRYTVDCQEQNEMVGKDIF
jgi:hypothetical protein